LIHSVKSVLAEDKFTDETKDAWVEVYGALSYDMIRAQKIKR
jgi:hemoglobin-like flavoprotein